MVSENRKPRTEPRISRKETARVVLASAPKRVRSAVVVDRSESGMGLRLAVQVHVGQKIIIEGCSFRGAGRICWVSSHNGFYSVGVDLTQYTAADSYRDSHSLRVDRIA